MSQILSPLFRPLSSAPTAAPIAQHTAVPLPDGVTLRTAHSADEAWLFHHWAHAILRLPDHRTQRRIVPLLRLVAQKRVGKKGADAFADDDVSDAAKLSDAREIAAHILSLPHPEPAALDRRMGWLADLLALDEAMRICLPIIARRAVHEDWGSFCELISFERGCNLSVGALQAMTGVAMADIHKGLMKGSRLAATGMVRLDNDDDVIAEDFLIRLARMEADSPDAMLTHLVRPAAPSALTSDDFAHLGEAAALALRLIETGQPCAILLYGPPGTGKTEFARVLAEQSGRQALFAGLDDDAGGEPSRHERLAHFTLLNAAVHNHGAHAGRYLVVLDEADDVLSPPQFLSRGSWSKQWVNRLVEHVAGPTVFILNDVHALPESVTRRMHFAIRFDPPGRGVRARMLARHAEAKGLHLAEDDAARLAMLPARPSMLANAVAGAAVCAGGADMADALARSLVEAVEGGPLPQLPALPAAYDPALAKASMPLDRLSTQLAAAPDLGWSLLLAGPSGTGKSAYAHHLARAIGIDIIERRGSDLLSKYVGETEQRIAAAFADARAQKAMLLIDEADDFLSDRRDADKSWERTRVAEMLRWMERLEAPFVATTNLSDRLDPATQRRFTLRVDFACMDEDAAAALFARYFGQDVPDGVRLIDQTPGDFAQVARRTELLGERDTRRIVAWLQAEATQRTDGKGPLGFAT